VKRCYVLLNKEDIQRLFPLNPILENAMVRLKRLLKSKSKWRNWIYLGDRFWYDTVCNVYILKLGQTQLKTQTAVLIKFSVYFNLCTAQNL